MTTEAELRADDAEKALLGAVGHHPDALADVLAALPGSDFYSPHRGLVWDACRELSARRTPIHSVTLGRHLVATEAWNPATRHVVTVELTDSHPAHLAGHHAEIVADLARRRELLRVLARATSVVAGDRPGDTSEALSLVRAELDRVDSPTTGDAPLEWDALVDEFEQVHAPGGSRPGIPTPWWELDAIIGGLFGGRVYVIGGRPGSGKSTAALIIAMHAAAESGKRSLVISKEMPTVDVTGRLLARGAEVPLSAINSRTVDDVGMARIRDYIKSVGRPTISVDARPRSLRGILSLARSHKHRVGLDVLVVDYVQLVRSENARSREQEVAEVSRNLKALALELDISVILPAQLNRESAKRADPRPVMADLRDSGQLEQDADAVILLHRETTESGEPTGRILFIVDKNRHGPTSEISLRWQGGYGEIG